MTVEYRSLEGTGACLGVAGTHAVIADRPEGRAGGTGLGFNGAQLLALSLGGCFCNDVHYTAHELGCEILHLRVAVSLDLAGEPLIATDARLLVECELADGTPSDELLRLAKERCTIAKSLRRGMNVNFQ